MPSTPIFNPHQVRSALTILAMTMTHSLLPVKTSLKGLQLFKSLILPLCLAAANKSLAFSSSLSSLLIFSSVEENINFFKKSLFLTNVYQSPPPSKI